MALEVYTSASFLSLPRLCARPSGAILPSSLFQGFPEDPLKLAAAAPGSNCKDQLALPAGDQHSHQPRCPLPKW